MSSKPARLDLGDAACFVSLGAEKVWDKATAKGNIKYSLGRRWVGRMVLLSLLLSFLEPFVAKGLPRDPAALLGVEEDSGPSVE